MVWSRLKSAEKWLVSRLGTDISTPAARAKAYLHFHLMDHGILRGFWTNLEEISPGVWRANQPSPRRLSRYKDMGIKTIINLRGENRSSPYLFEQERSRQLGMTLRSFRLNARKLVKPAAIIDLLDAFDTFEKPFLMHCKSGADRAGLASALYLLHVQNVPVSEAKKQLSFKYLHLRSSKTGILDQMLDAYEADNLANPIPIRDWLETLYKPEEIARKFNEMRATR